MFYVLSYFAYIKTLFKNGPRIDGRFVFSRSIYVRRTNCMAVTMLLVILRLLLLLLLPLLKRPYAYTTHISTHNLLFRTQELCKFFHQHSNRIKKKPNQIVRANVQLKRAIHMLPFFIAIFHLISTGPAMYFTYYLTFHIVFHYRIECFTSENCVCLTRISNT